jgi:hypothetical protein
MSIDERSLRSRLTETAGQAGPLRFSPEDLAARVRGVRRRRRQAWVGAAVVVVAAGGSAIGIPLGVGAGGPGAGGPGGGGPGGGGPGVGGPGVISSPAPLPPGLSYTVTVNGHSQALPAQGPPEPAEYYVTPEEKVTITVVVAVPAHPAITFLKLGITDGTLGPGELNQVLAASARGQLRPGAHRFVMHWTAPTGLGPGATRLLAVDWAWPGGEVEGGLATFTAPPGTPFSAAAVRRLRVTMLAAASGCGDPRPEWIVAVRTTRAAAAAAIGDRGDISGDTGQAVYLLVMKGHFSGNHAMAPPCAHAAPGHYYAMIVDAATFASIEMDLRAAPPAVRLASLGPVASLT